MQIVFTLSLFICLCHSFVLGFAKMQQHKIQRLEGIQAFLLQAPTAWSLSRSAVPRNNHTQNSFPKEIPAGKRTTRWRFPFFSMPQTLHALLEQICSQVSAHLKREDPQGNPGWGTALTDAPLPGMHGPAVMYFDNSEIILGSCFVVSLRTAPGRPQEMVQSAGGGEHELTPCHGCCRASSVPSHGDPQDSVGLSHQRGGHSPGPAQQEVPRHLTQK